MANATAAKRVLATRETQQLVMVRCITKVIGAKKFTFWQAEGQEMHIGRGCHMKAMSDAVRNAPVKVVIGKVVAR
jgi:hypothetical protein